MLILIILAAILSYTASASPKLTYYEGHNANTKIPCYITVNRIFSLNNIPAAYNPQAEILVEILDPNYHGMQRNESFEFTAIPSMGKIGFFEGSNDISQQITLAVDAQKKLHQIKRFVVKWRHIDHYHQVICINLKKYFDRGQPDLEENIE